MGGDTSSSGSPERTRSRDRDIPAGLTHWCMWGILFGGGHLDRGRRGFRRLVGVCDEGDGRYEACHGLEGGFDVSVPWDGPFAPCTAVMRCRFRVLDEQARPPPDELPLMIDEQRVLNAPMLTTLWSFDAPFIPVMQAPRTILHLDLNTFFVSVERLREPKLNGRPVLMRRRQRPRRGGFVQLRGPRLRHPQRHAHEGGQTAVPGGHHPAG